jgi:chromosomal replication initiator protein
LTSDKPPAEINGLDQRLRSRFEGGLIADIHPPTRAMRMAIVKAKARELGIDLPSDVANILVERDVTSVRELEGTLTRVVATAEVGGQAITLELAKEALRSWVSSRNSISVEAIQQAVSRHFGIVLDDLLSHRRDRRVVFPRQVAMYLSRVVAEETYPFIAEKFGGRDHSTVMHAVRVVEQKRESDATLARSLATLEGELRLSA